MSPDRREFLGTVLAAGLVPGAIGPGDGRRARSTRSVPASSPSGASDWDFTWIQRLAGKHRAAFDWPKPEASAGLWRAVVWKQQVTEHLGAAAEDVTAVLVIRHSAIPMIMGDAFWSRHKLGKLRKLKDPFSGKIATRNPYRRFEGAEADSSIEGFLKGGGIVLACGFAFGFMVSLEAKLQEKPAAEVRPEVLKEVIPGIIIQPSGFFALLEAQRNGCGVFPADVGV